MSSRSKCNTNQHTFDSLLSCLEQNLVQKFSFWGYFLAHPVGPVGPVWEAIPRLSGSRVVADLCREQYCYCQSSDSKTLAELSASRHDRQYRRQP